MELNRRLENFSKELVPSEDFLKVGNETADRIFRLLKKSREYSVDRVKIARSIGKTSAVCVDPDYDLVVFLNNEHPFFKDVLSNFEDILNLPDMDIRNVKVTKFSIQFEVNVISFDLLPATNFVTEAHQPGGSELAIIQANRTMEFIRMNPGFGYKYGSAVCEQQIQFLKNQSPFVHQVVRLAKFWNKTLNMSTYISGRSTMIELIGIEAMKTQEAQGRRSCLEAFKIFLSLMSRFDTLCVKNCSYNLGRIPRDVENQRPLVMDPVNPYNNFAYFSAKDKTGIIKTFKEFAYITLMRLNDCKDMDQLFQVQPKVFVPGPHPGKWTLGSTEMALINLKMVVRISDEEFKLKEWGVREVKQRLMTTLAALTLDGRSVDVMDVRNRIKGCVDLNILGLSFPRDCLTPNTRTTI